MIVILIIAVLLSVAIPQFMSARSRSRQKTCASNLKQLNGAKEQHAMETNLSDGALVVSGDLVPSYLKEFPFCPDGGTYTLNPIGTGVSCSENAGTYAHIYQY